MLQIKDIIERGKVREFNYGKVPTVQIHIHKWKTMNGCLMTTVIL